MKNIFKNCNWFLAVGEPYKDKSTWQMIVSATSVNSLFWWIDSQIDPYAVKFTPLTNVSGVIGFHGWTDEHLSYATDDEIDGDDTVENMEKEGNFSIDDNEEWYRFSSEYGYRKTVSWEKELEWEIPSED